MSTNYAQAFQKLTKLRTTLQPTRDEPASWHIVVDSAT